MTRIILASASPRRRELLAQIDLKFEVIPSLVSEEGEPLSTPAKTAEYLAVIKAEDVAGKLTGDGYVIGADTIVVLDGVLYGKPVNKADARGMLTRLQGRAHQVITGIAVIRLRDKEILVEHETTTVMMRPLTLEEVDRYIDTGEPMDKAGAYAIQGRGAVFIPSISGCYFNVVGLPLARLLSMLNKLGWSNGNE